MLIEQCITHITSLDYHGEWLGQELRKHYGIDNGPNSQTDDD